MIEFADPDEPPVFPLPISDFVERDYKTGLAFYTRTDPAFAPYQPGAVIYTLTQSEHIRIGLVVEVGGVNDKRVRWLPTMDTDTWYPKYRIRKLLNGGQWSKQTFWTQHEMDVQCAYFHSNGRSRGLPSFILPKWIRELDRKL